MVYEFDNDDFFREDNNSFFNKEMNRKDDGTNVDDLIDLFSDEDEDEDNNDNDEDFTVADYLDDFYYE